MQSFRVLRNSNFKLKNNKPCDLGLESSYTYLSFHFTDIMEIRRFLSYTLACKDGHATIK